MTPDFKTVNRKELNPTRNGRSLRQNFHVYEDLPPWVSVFLPYNILIKGSVKMSVPSFRYTATTKTPVNRSCTVSGSSNQ